MNFVDPPLPLEITPILNHIHIWTGNNQHYITYELKIVNGSNQTVNLTSLLINETLYKNLSILFSKLSTVNQYEPEKAAVLLPNECGILFIQKCVKKNYNYINNILNITVNQQCQSIASNAIKISSHKPIIVHAPLKGTNWFIVNGFHNEGSHRRAAFIINGNIKLPERFAVDIIKYNKHGKLLKGDSYKNESYYAYGQTVYAAASGVVVNARNDMKDNQPGKPITTITSQTINGNFLLIKHDDDHYMYYAHMIPGSVRYEIGDYVNVGEPIGLLGNSGGSFLPHLHFHVSDKPYPLAGQKLPAPVNSQGIPWAINQFIKKSYTKEGHSPLLYDIPLTLNVVGNEVIKNQIVMHNDLVNFKNNQYFKK